VIFVRTVHVAIPEACLVAFCRAAFIRSYFMRLANTVRDVCQVRVIACRVLENLHVNLVGTGSGQPNLFSTRLGEVKAPTIDVRPPVVHSHDRLLLSIGDEEFCAKR